MKNLNKIEPLETLSLVDKAEIQVLKYFKENNLKPGDSIPKELEFSEAFGVSRTVVREALLRLRTLGIVDSKKHKGMVLTQPDLINNFARIMDSSLLSSDTLRNLFEFRLILEIGIADFLFEHKTQKDLDELEIIVALEEETSFEKNRFSLDREIAFHGKLYQMSNNVTVQGFQDLLLPVFEYEYLQESGRNNGDYSYSSGQFITHRMLMDNLKVGTPETYRNAMRRHLEPHFDRIFKNGKTDN